MARVERDAHFEALVLHLLHALHRHGVEGRHVVVAQLLVRGRGRGRGGVRVRVVRVGVRVSLRVSLGLA